MARLRGLIAGSLLGAACATGAIVAYQYATWRPRRLDNLYQHRPLLLGHRGASAEVPENTLPAFRRAIEAGADGVELDVHLSRDGQPVVTHDESLARVAGVDVLVRDLALEEIQALDVGSWRGAEFAGVRIPTLAEVLDALGPHAIVNIELKGTHAAADGLERAVLQEVFRHDAFQRVICSSFNPLRLWRLRRLEPRLARALLHAPGLPRPLRDLWFLPLVQPDALHPHYSQVTHSYMARARRWGVRVNAWTVDDPDEARRLVTLGIDGLITNDPCRLAAGLTA